MFCDKCGAQLDADSRFCPCCGAAAAAQPPEKPEAAAAKARFFSGRKKLFALLGTAVLILGIAIGLHFYFSRPTTIYVDPLLQVEYSGLSTRGTAEIGMDSQALSELLKQEMSEEELYLMMAQITQSGILLELDRSQELTNGDEVHITFYMDNEIARQYGVQFALRDSTVLVSGLQEPVYLDLFADLKLVYTGCSPYARVAIEKTSDDPFIRDNVRYELSSTANLSEGDRFTVTASFSESAAAEAGYIILDSTKEFTATNLPQPLVLDPFDHVQVIFSGLEGNGSASLQKQNDVEFMNYIEFRFDKRTSLVEGDILTLSYTVSGDRDPLKYGCTLTGSSAREFTVPKLGTYMTDFAQLTAEEQQKLMSKATEVAKLYLTRENAENLTGIMYLAGTGSSKNNQLSYAESLSNVQLHSMLLAKPTQWYSNPYLYFVFTVDIVGHPKIKENGGSATGAVYLYLPSPIAKGDGTLEINYESSYIFSVDNQVYLSYGALHEAVLKSLYEPSAFTPEN